MIKSLYIYVLLTGTMFPPCVAQWKPMAVPMEDTRRNLGKPQTDAKRGDLLLDLALDYVFLPGENPKDLDSALLLTRQAEKLNERLKSRKLAARIDYAYSAALRESGRTEAGRHYIETALSIYKTLQEPDAAGLAWFERATYFSGNNNDQLAGKKECFENALPLFTMAGDKENEAFALKNLADCNMNLNNQELAAKQLLEALAIYRDIGYKDLQGVYDLLGIVSSQKGDFSDAVKFGFQALHTAESLHDTSIQLCTIYNRLGLAYSNLGVQDQALLNWKRAMEIATKFHDISQMRWVMLNLCFGYVKIGNWEESNRCAASFETALKPPWDKYDSLFLAMAYANAYTRGRSYAKAEARVGEIFSLLTLHPAWRREADIAYPVIIRYYMATKQYTEAQKYASLYLSIELSIHQKKNIAKGYDLMASVDSGMGNYAAALSDYKMFKKITDSMLNESTEFQFAEKQVEFETEQKDNDIKLLKQQQLIEQSSLARTRITNVIVLISIMVLALVCALLYNRYRVKQRLNKELEIKQRQINEKNTALEGLVTEKDWLVREIHHRVKNNLQIVMSLLNSQSAYLKDETALSAIRQSQHRVEAIALLHRKLYQSENLTVIDMPSYIREVAEYLAGNVESGHRIHFEVKIAPIVLDVSQAVPLGLIINEAVTNSIKYAFPGGEKGWVRIGMEPAGDGYLELSIRDNGTGLPDGLDIAHSTSLGMSLMNGLAKQLDGELSLRSQKGVTVIVRFKPAKTV